LHAYAGGVGWPLRTRAQPYFYLLSPITEPKGTTGTTIKQTCWIFPHDNPHPHPRA